MMVKLFKQEGTYVNNEGKEKRFTNFFIECGDTRVPIEVSYFPQDKFDGRDPNYAGRKEVVKAFAENLPAKSREAISQSSSTSEVVDY